MITYTIEVTSACYETNIKLRNQDADYRSWYSLNENELYFMYQIGKDPTLLEIDLIDTVSFVANDVISFWQNKDPYCGKNTFSISFEEGDELGPHQTLSLMNLVDWKPELHLAASEFDYNSLSEVNAYGVYGGTPIGEGLLVQTI